MDQALTKLAGETTHVAHAPLVTIVIVNHNYGNFIEECIRSVDAQDYPNIQCIVLDCASSDASLSIIGDALRQTKRRIFRLLSQNSNHGHLINCLSVLDQARGEFISYLDADDFLFPEFISTHVKAHLNDVDSAALSVTDQKSGRRRTHPRRHMSLASEMEGLRARQRLEGPDPCPKLDGTWLPSAPSSPTVTCTITAAGVVGDYGAAGYLDVSVDGAPVSRVKIPASTDPTVAKTTVTVNVGVKGAHGITATAVSRALKTSPTVTYGFGWGDAASLTSPGTGATSSGKVVVAAGGPPRGGATAVTAQVQWRVAGSAAGAWTDAAGPVPVAAPSASTLAAFTSVFDLKSAVRETGATVDVPKRTPVRLDVQVCFTYAGTAVTRCTWEPSPVTVTRLPHAFGDGYPTTDAGVGQVAQYTGEVAISGTDVSVPGYTGDISISRSHTSFAGDGSVANWPTDSVTGVFGPGFTANLDGADAGLAGLTVVDNTGIDASVAFVDEEGEPLVFTTAAGTRVYPTAAATSTPPPSPTSRSWSTRPQRCSSPAPT